MKGCTDHFYLSYSYPSQAILFREIKFELFKSQTQLRYLSYWEKEETMDELIFYIQDFQDHVMDYKNIMP